jgi:DNA-binding CsgD family transcriptional regulator
VVSHRQIRSAAITDMVGRGEELALVERFIDAIAAGPVALLLQGEAGIGKTTLWKRGLGAALVRSRRVLSSHPVQAETRLSYAALGDLLDEALDESLPRLPEPQRMALEVALLRVPAEGKRPDQRAISLALLGTLRTLSASAPVLVAIDDLQWLDPPSARVLRFALRRLKDEQIGLLGAVRGSQEDDDPFGFLAAFGPDRRERIRIGPLSIDAIHQLLRAHLGSTLPRPTLVQLHRTSGGNPFFALEIARALLRRGGETPPGETLPIPDSLQDLIQDRLAGLPTEARSALEVVAAMSHPTLPLVTAAGDGRGGSRGISSAFDASVVELDGDRIRFTHPLLGSAVYQSMPPSRRRGLHRRLADVVVDPEERARHLALSVEGPDEDVAAALDRAAHRARSRGAPDAAAELSEMAGQLTQPNRIDDYLRRTIQAAVAHFDAGDTQHARRLLEEGVDVAPSGPRRASLLLHLGMVRSTESTWLEATRLFERGLLDAGDDPALRAPLEQSLGYAGLFTGDLHGAERHARKALRLARKLGDEALPEPLGALGFLDFVLGRGLRLDRMEEAMKLEERIEDWGLVLRPSFCFAQLLKYSDRLDEARGRFHTLLDVAAERGQENALAVLHYHLAELEVRSGNWQAAEQHAAESVSAGEQTGAPFYQSMGLYAKALIDAHVGRVSSARKEAEEGLSLAERIGVVTSQILNRSVLGFLALSEEDPSAAHQHLSRAVGLASSMGVVDPGYFRLLPDEVEALVALGDMDQARALLEPFEQRGRRLNRTWALAAAARCRGLLAAATGDLDAADESIRRAIDWGHRLGQPFELARTLVTNGVILRRARRKREARESLQRALATFEDLGAALWSARARAELGRIGGRAASSASLTPTEERVAGLVASGRTNREVAAGLFMSVNTVEANLKRIYRKLGVRSRTELAQRIPPSGSLDSS